MTAGERIRARRKEIGMTQLELANAIGPVTFGLISNYENNVVKDIPMEKIRLMAKALDCDPLWLAYGVLPDPDLTLEQLILIDMIKNATPQQVEQVMTYARFVMQ